MEEWNEYTTKNNKLKYFTIKIKKILGYLFSPISIIELLPYYLRKIAEYGNYHISIILFWFYLTPFMIVLFIHQKISSDILLILNNIIHFYTFLPLILLTSLTLIVSSKKKGLVEKYLIITSIYLTLISMIIIFLSFILKTIYNDFLIFTLLFFILHSIFTLLSYLRYLLAEGLKLAQK